MGKAKKNIEENTGPEVKSFWENKVLEFFLTFIFYSILKCFVRNQVYGMSFISYRGIIAYIRFFDNNPLT